MDDAPKVQEPVDSEPAAPLTVDELLMDEDPRSYSLLDGWKDKESEDGA